MTEAAFNHNGHLTNQPVSQIAVYNHIHICISALVVGDEYHFFFASLSLSLMRIIGPCQSEWHETK